MTFKQARFLATSPESSKELRLHKKVQLSTEEPSLSLKVSYLISTIGHAACCLHYNQRTNLLKQRHQNRNLTGDCIEGKLTFSYCRWLGISSDSWAISLQTLTILIISFSLLRLHHTSYTQQVADAFRITSKLYTRCGKI